MPKLPSGCVRWGGPPFTRRTGTRELLRRPAGVAPPRSSTYRHEETGRCCYETRRLYTSGTWPAGQITDGEEQLHQAKSIHDSFHRHYHEATGFNPIATELVQACTSLPRQQDDPLWADHSRAFAWVRADRPQCSSVAPSTVVRGSAKMAIVELIHNTLQK